MKQNHFYTNRNAEMKDEPQEKSRIISNTHLTSPKMCVCGDCNVRGIVCRFFFSLVPSSPIFRSHEAEYMEYY